MYCDVIVPGTHLHELTYSFDPQRHGSLALGDCVEVTVRGRSSLGIVARIARRSAVEQVLEIRGLVAPRLVQPDILVLVQWLAGYYLAPKAEAIGSALPFRLSRSSLLSEGLAWESRPGSRECPSEPAMVAPERGRFSVRVSARREGRIALACDFVTDTLARGSAVVLLPEFGRADWLAALRDRFAERVIELHSRSTASGQRRAWHSARSTPRVVVLGFRSAAFAPLGDLAGMVIVDEHDKAYKEERYPRYHARDVAVKRAQLEDLPVLMLDPTPSAETWLNLAEGRYGWLDTPRGGRRGSGVFVVDMRRHRGELFSPLLRRELERCPEHGIGLVYLNRQGVSRHIVCRECGELVACPGCKAGMAVGEAGVLECRYCGRVEPARDRCRSCGGSAFLYRAPGVRLVADRLRREHPRRPVSILTAASGNEVPLDRRGLVVGTRALLSRDWPENTKVLGVLSFDQELMLPDFRARERAFQLMANLEARCRDRDVRLVVQTWRPNEPALDLALKQDVECFMTGELAVREAAGLPPYRRLTAVTLRGRSGQAVDGAAERLAARLAVPGVEVIGPASLRSDSGGRRRSRLLLLASKRRGPVMRLDGVAVDERGVEVRVDVDPFELF